MNRPTMRTLWTSVLLFVLNFSISARAQCPSQDPELIPWNPPPDVNRDEVIDGQKYLLVNSTELRSITILNSGRLVIADSGTPIKLRIRQMLIHSDGEFHIGSPECPHQSPVEIALFGRSDEGPSDPFFGRKFIGVQATGTIVIHGQTKLAWTFLERPLIEGSVNPIVYLADDASTWSPGDRVVIASSDYDWTHAEEFDLAYCSSCQPNQVQLTGTVQFAHSGQLTAEQVDVRAEVALLTRNIKIYGEMEPDCYAGNMCQFFDYDTFGGQTQVLVGVRRAHFYGIELYNMGQQSLGSYPIHFHRVGEAYGLIAQQLSIHDCFSRCVTIHSSNGVRVEDVVGYNTLGHCFFLEDGNEQDNVFVHNLGLLTKAGTLLPSDRNAEMCAANLDGVYPGYVPDVEKECMGVSTFWIAHPNNSCVNNSAAGSERNGFFIIFHRVPTGLSPGTLPPFHGERSPLQLFQGNRGHSNNNTGFLMDRGVKVEAPSQQDPAETLSLQDYARYMPHENQDILQPRVPAIIKDFTAYKNRMGIFVRGGDVFIHGARLTDNDIGVQMMSDIGLPPDAGSHQEVVDSILVSTSNADEEWQNRTYPSVGIQFCEGPLSISDNLFFEYRSVGGRQAYGVGFCPQHAGQITHSIHIPYNTFDAGSNRAYFGRVGGIWGSYDSDGDMTQVFHDAVGSLTGEQMVYAVRADNRLMQRDDGSCFLDNDLNAAICSGLEYGQIFINVSIKGTDILIQRDPPTDGYTLTMKGSNRLDTVNYPDSTQFQPVLVANDSYRIQWFGAIPNTVTLNPVNFRQWSYIRLAFHYRGFTATSVRLVVWQQMENVITSQQPLTLGNSLADVDSDPNGFTYYFDGTFLYVKMVNRFPFVDFYYCPLEGCQMIWIDVKNLDQETL